MQWTFMTYLLFDAHIAYFLTIILFDQNRLGLTTEYRARTVNNAIWYGK